MHAYFNDPTGIRSASISEPMLKSETFGIAPHYMVCLRFNAKQSGNTYAGTKEIAGVFIGGRFDHFVEKPRDLCTEASYTPFPELEKLSR
jgi:hypothetical protein